jgi:aminoglycoside 6-adenylyltransferase
MRSELEVFDLILTVALDDDRIRAVILNGSRANQNAAPDIFQDFDIIYLVTELAPFFNNTKWIERFGDLMILQMPDLMEDPPDASKISFTYLMQFTDGNRIDLCFFPLNRLEEMEADSLSLVLLDKDGILPVKPTPNESSYLPRPPTEKQFADCCNEFWWVCPYVAKGLWRSEIIYAKGMLDQVLREQLMKMTIWYMGVKTHFSKNPGKFGKYIQQYLEPDVWEMLLKTYPNAGYAQIWESLFTMGDLYRILAKRVGDHFGFEYPSGDDERVSAHLRHVKSLPKDAQEMYPWLHRQSKFSNLDR